MTYLKTLLKYVGLRYEFWRRTKGIIINFGDTPFFCQKELIESKIKVLECVLNEDLDGLRELGFNPEIRFTP
jgi:hypothetical protein